MTVLKFVVLGFFVYALVHVTFFSDFDNKIFLVVSFSCCLVVWSIIFFKKEINNIVFRKRNL
ncbi:hypothetical protein SAMN05660226_03384 [Parapedobacter luteus]|uniref:Uncharacterized protein n=1 Tax=Parapedobacter luteus TaxID=623280 RepID=A0A1T5EKW5_9SPHI|nr:hypothetical protein SAMN05660226_03384 [Parapedobacter luteus]